MQRERGEGLERRENAAIGKGRKTKNEECSAILLISVKIKTGYVCNQISKQCLENTIMATTTGSPQCKLLEDKVFFIYCVCKCTYVCVHVHCTHSVCVCVCMC